MDDGHFRIYFYIIQEQVGLKKFELKLNKLSTKLIQLELNATGATSYKLSSQLEPLTNVHFSPKN